MPQRKKKIKKPKRRLSKEEKRLKRERKAQFENIFINGKQKRVKRSTYADLPSECYNDPIFLKQNEMYPELHAYEMREALVDWFNPEPMNEFKNIEDLVQGIIDEAADEGAVRQMGLPFESQDHYSQSEAFEDDIPF